MSGYPSNSDSVAQDQLVDFVRRIENPGPRLAYVMDRLERCKGISSHAFNRALSLSAEVLGIDFQSARRAWRRWSFGQDMSVVDVGPLGDVAGYVYLGRIPGQPNLIKVGFSRVPSRRVRELSIGGPGFHIVKTFVGTMLDEHVVHCDRRALRVQGEWFRARAA